MRDLNDLYFFVQVVEHGGFAAAARANTMQKSKLSRRIQQLEDRLGVRLIHRSTRHFSVTEVGREYYERCVAMLVEAEAADQAVAEIRAEPRGTIRISCPIVLLNYRYGALLARFLARHPSVKVVLESTNRHVDVIAEGFDVAIRARFPPLEATDLVMRKLESLTLSLVASPELLAGRSITSPADLISLPSVAMGPSQRDHHWRLERDDGQAANISFWPRFISDDLPALRDAAIEGVGIVQLPTMMVADAIAAGKLVEVLPDWKPRTVIVHAVFPSRRGVVPSVRALLDFLAAGPSQDD